MELWRQFSSKSPDSVEMETESRALVILFMLKCTWSTSSYVSKCTYLVSVYKIASLA